jgi:hypothetical protein
MKWPRWLTGRRIARIVGFLIFASVATLVFGKYYVPPAPAQPVPFSHRVHVTTKGLNCFFCHPYATRSDHAGLPPVEKCYLCHKVIASKFSPIAKVVGYYERNEPIPWQRVYVLPDFVHFSHQAHLAKRIDCGECHGNVAEMDRVGLQQKIDMNWCIDCHWRNNAPDNCNTCHY